PPVRETWIAFIYPTLTTGRAGGGKTASFRKLYDARPSPVALYVAVITARLASPSGEPVTTASPPSRTRPWAQNSEVKATTTEDMAMWIGTVQRGTPMRYCRMPI